MNDNTYEKVYLRFGNIPEDKKSKLHRGDAIVKIENGVSVWNCVFVNDVPFPLLPDSTNEDGTADYFYHLLGNKPVYLVTGTELDEKGSVNEPLLGTDIEIVKEYTKDYEYLKTILNQTSEPLSEDCISREAAIRIAEQGQIQGYEWQFKELCTLPSVTPQQRIGYWEYVQYDNNPNIGNWHCSECRGICREMHSIKDAYNYCPNCGAKMEVEEWSQ